MSKEESDEQRQLIQASFSSLQKAGRQRWAVFTASLAESKACLCPLQTLCPWASCSVSLHLFIRERIIEPTSRNCEAHLC